MRALCTAMMEEVHIPQPARADETRHTDYIGPQMCSQATDGVASASQVEDLRGRLILVHLCLGIVARLVSVPPAAADATPAPYASNSFMIPEHNMLRFALGS
jgi:hypothetical protein